MASHLVPMDRATGHLSQGGERVNIQMLLVDSGHTHSTATMCPQGLWADLPHTPVLSPTGFQVPPLPLVPWDGTPRRVNLLITHRTWTLDFLPCNGRNTAPSIRYLSYQQAMDEDNFSIKW